MAPLHVTNGDAAVAPLRAGGVEGTIIPWRDVLHDGPVPALGWNALRETRARFIAARGWGNADDVLRTFEERDTALFEALAQDDDVTLWFEHDLYDQLQLIQVLAMSGPAVCSGAPVWIAEADDYLGTLPPDAVRKFAARRRRAGQADVALASDAWNAFTAPAPVALRAFVAADRADFDALPFLRPALRRLLEEYPDPATGLSRTETQALHAIAGGATTLGAAYQAAHHAMESPIWLGDASFVACLEELVRDGGPLEIEPPPQDGRGPMMQAAVRLAPGAGAVLAGERGASWRTLDRWIGGTHIRSVPT